VAERLAAGPAHAFSVAKELLNQSAGMDRLEAHLDRELDELSRVADGPEFAEGLRAFFEKRPAAFSAAGDWRLAAGDWRLGTGEAETVTSASSPQPPAPSLKSPAQR
jgi:hypothetical protein